MANVRLFTAVSVSREAQDALRDILGKVAKVPSGIRWVTPQQFHITLQFLGVREEFLVPKLLEVFRILAERYRPFDMALGGLDGFPRLVQARVLFVPVILGQEGLAALAEDMVRVTQPLGIPPEERDFHAHLTLGRVKSAKGVREAVEIL